jgi:hypothetical protein
MASRAMLLVALAAGACAPDEPRGRPARQPAPVVPTEQVAAAEPAPEVIAIETLAEAETEAETEAGTSPEAAPAPVAEPRARRRRAEPRPPRTIRGAFTRIDDDSVRRPVAGARICWLPRSEAERWGAEATDAFKRALLPTQGTWRAAETLLGEVVPLAFRIEDVRGRLPEEEVDRAAAELSAVTKAVRVHRKQIEHLERPRAIETWARGLEAGLLDRARIVTRADADGAFVLDGLPPELGTVVAIVADGAEVSVYAARVSGTAPLDLCERHEMHAFRPSLIFVPEDHRLAAERVRFAGERSRLDALAARLTRFEDELSAAATQNSVPTTQPGG